MATLRHRPPAADPAAERCPAPRPTAGATSTEREILALHVSSPRLPFSLASGRGRGKTTAEQVNHVSTDGGRTWNEGQVEMSVRRSP